MQKEFEPMHQLEAEKNRRSRIRAQRESLIGKIGTDKVWIGFQAPAALDKVEGEQQPEVVIFEAAEEEKKKEYLQRVIETRRKRGTKGVPLHPDSVENLIEKVKVRYQEGEKIPIRGKEFLELVQLSHETVNMATSLAKRDGIIPDYTNRYTREEIIAALNHREKLWQEGKSIFAEGEKARRQAREKRQTSNNLTIKEAAKTLDIPVPVFVAWITEGKIGDSNLRETIERIRNPLYSRQKLIDSSLLEGEEIKTLTDELYWTKLKNHMNLQYHRERFFVVSEVAEEAAGRKVSFRLIPVLTEKLREKGIFIKDIPLKESDEIISYYRVGKRKDREEAVRIVREVIDEDPRFARYR